MQSDALPRAALSTLVRQGAEKVSGRKRDDWPYIGLEHLESGSPFLAGSAHSSVSTSTNNVFHAGDVLFGKLRSYLLKSVGAPFSGYCSTDLIVLRTEDGIDPSFAAKVFQSAPVFARAVATSIGTKMPRTSWGALKRLEVFTPPLPEQRRIAEILDTLDEAIRKTEQVIAKLQQMKQGLLHDLLTRGIDEHGELRDPERHPEQFKDSALGRIPRRWDVARLGVRLAGIDAGWSPSCPEEPPTQDQWGVLKVSAVSSGIYRPHESKRLPHGLRPVPDLEVRANDVLCARANGVAELVGRAVYVETTPTKLMLSDKTLRLRPSADTRPRFLYFLLSGAAARRQIGRLLNGSSGQRNISQAQIRSLLVAMPPVDEQAAAEAAVGGLERRVQQEGEHLDKLRTLKHGLMDDLLTGRVRVAVPSGAAT